MSRPLRCEFPGSWYHVTARGNERKNIFRDERDREPFVELLADLEARFEMEVHGFVFMDNHYHQLLRMRGRQVAAFASASNPVTISRQSLEVSGCAGLVSGVVLFFDEPHDQPASRGAVGRDDTAA